MGKISSPSRISLCYENNRQDLFLLFSLSHSLHLYDVGNSRRPFLLYNLDRAIREIVSKWYGKTILNQIPSRRRRRHQVKEIQSVSCFPFPNYSSLYSVFCIFFGTIWPYYVRDVNYRVITLNYRDIIRCIHLTVTHVSLSIYVRYNRILVEYFSKKWFFSIFRDTSMLRLDKFII